MATNSKRDYYEILEVERDSDQQAIKQKYRKLALKYHPDRNSGDSESESKFKEISEAYQVLSDPAKRQKYDQFGHQGLNGSGFQPFTGFDEIFESFGDIFGDFFGGARRNRSRAMAGEDLRYDLTIEFMDSVRGVEKEIEVEKLTLCQACNGNGSRPGSTPIVCPNCGGSGQIKRSQGFFMLSTPCSRCHGIGQIIQDPCPDCGGFGKTEKRKKLTVKIPAGVDTGSRIRLRGEGEPGLNGGPYGDLYIFLRVKEHDLFQRHGDDILIDYPISFSQAALGCICQIDLLDGEETLKIPSGTQHGRNFVFKGRGVKNLRTNGNGDFYVRVTVLTPTHLNQDQKRLLEELAQYDEKIINSGKKKTLFEKIRNSIT